MILERHAAYKAALESLASLSEQDLADAMAEIPAEIQERLAAGPLPSRFHCGVCVAFGKDFYGSPDNHDPESAMFRVWGYHEVAKLAMRVRDDEWYGTAANEHYERTIATYRAAGWAGQAQEANA